MISRDRSLTSPAALRSRSTSSPTLNPGEILSLSGSSSGKYDSSRLSKDFSPDDRRHSVTSKEDFAGFQIFLKDADNLLARVELRKQGYNRYKKFKKQASALKHTLKNAFSDAASLLTKGKTVEKRTKLDELSEITNDLIAKYETLSKLFMDKTVKALDKQNAVAEKANSYMKRLKSCVAHNRKVAAKLEHEWTVVFAFICELDESIKSFRRALTFQSSVIEQRANQLSASFIPWVVRMGMDEEEQKRNEEIETRNRSEEEKKKEHDALLRSQLEKKIEALEDARIRAKELMNDIMRVKEDADCKFETCDNAQQYLDEVMEDIFFRIDDDEEGDEDSISSFPLESRKSQSKSTRLMRHKSIKSIRSMKLDIDHPDAEFDHSTCADCDIVCSIARSSADQLANYFYGSEETANALNELLVKGELLQEAKIEIEENFTAWGDLPQSYTGGVYSPPP